MENKIIICGLNGVGKNTLGKNLAKALDYKFLDIENYYFPKNNTDYYYINALTRDEVQTSLLNDLKKYDNLILASVKGNYCNEVEALLTKAIYFVMGNKIISTVIIMLEIWLFSMIMFFQ